MLYFKLKIPWLKNTEMKDTTCNITRFCYLKFVLLITLLNYRVSQKEVFTNIFCFSFAQARWQHTVNKSKTWNSSRLRGEHMFYVNHPRAHPVFDSHPEWKQSCRRRCGRGCRRLRCSTAGLWRWLSKWLPGRGWSWTLPCSYLVITKSWPAGRQGYEKLAGCKSAVTALFFFSVICPYY